MKTKFQIIKNVSLIVLGNICLALGTSLFILPHGIINGGTSGISLIIEGFFNINPNLTISVLTWFLFFMGVITLGKAFTFKTLLSTVLYPILINTFTNLDVLVNLASEVTNTMLAAITGATLTGVGLGIVYREGASTGGVDVISLIMQKYFHVKLSVSTFAIDALIIILGLVSLSLENALYGLISVMIASYLIEKITISGTSSYMAHIVSDKWEEINEFILSKMERGTTLIKAEGGLTNESKMLIEVVFSEKEYYDMKKNVYSVDPSAFISVYKSVNTYGNGFEEVTLKSRRS